VEENAYLKYMAMQIGEPYVFSEAEPLQEDLGPLPNRSWPIDRIIWPPL